MFKSKKIVVVVFLVVFCSFLMVACTSVFDQYEAYIAEFRPDLYLYKTPDYEIEVASGYREKDFAIDGIVADKVDFSIVTVEPSGGVLDGMTMNYELKFDNQTFSGKMAKHPFNESFSAEIKQRTLSKPVVLTLFSDGKRIGEFSMKVAATDQMIGHTRALEIAAAKLKSQITSMTHNGRLKGEIFLLFVKNPLDENDSLYWYVAFVNTTNNTFAILIDPTTEKILAQHI